MGPFLLFSKTHTSAAPLLLEKGAEVKMKLQDLKLLIINTLKQKGTIHSKLHFYKNKRKKFHINPSWHLEMCSKLSASLVQKGQKVLPSYFSVKFASMSYILVLALKMTLAYFGLRAVKYVD